MIQDTEKTNVEFYRATYDDDINSFTEILAVFTDTKQEIVYNGKNDDGFDCYAHLGQHSICSQSFLAENCQKANETEYQDLKTELESIGYNLNIV